MMDVGGVVKGEADFNADVKGSLEAVDIDRCTKIVVELDNWGSSFFIRFEGGSVGEAVF